MPCSPMSISKELVGEQLVARSIRRGGYCLASLLLLCSLIYGQSNEPSRPQQADGQRARTVGLSELALDNLNRVAASPSQIRAVLVKDTGLLVELKRWVAKEATDNGQIVEECKALRSGNI